MNKGSWRKERVQGTLAMGWGHDHALGRFLTIWRIANPIKSLQWPENMPDDDNLVVDIDEMFTALTDKDLVKEAAKHGFTLSADDLK